MNSVETVLHILNFDLFLGKTYMVWYSLMSQSSSSKLKLPVSHVMILYSVLYCQHFLNIVFVFLYPIISTKCPCVSLAFTDKGKAVTLEMKLKITAQL